MRKLLTFVLILLLGSVWVTILNIGIVKAQGTIYIREDGSVEGTDKIQIDGDVYAFISDINGSIVVEKDSIVIDGGGYILQGTGDGIRLVGGRNRTIKNIEIKYFTRGIILQGSSNTTISGNTIENNEYGISLLYSADNNTISGNEIGENSHAGIFMNQVLGNVILTNNITNNKFGILTYEVSYNKIIENRIKNNNRGISSSFNAKHIVYHNIFIENIVQVYYSSSSISTWDNGSEGNYWSNYNGTDNDGDGIGDTPYIIDENNQDNYPLLEPIDFSESSEIYIRADGSIEGTDKIQRNGDIYTFTGNISGVIQIQKSNIIVDGAGYTLQGDGEMHGPKDILGMGLEIVECKNVTIRDLKIKGFSRGIRFTNSSDCNIYQNSLTNNSRGIEIGYGDEPYSNNNTVSGNLIKENDSGILLIRGSSNTIAGNIITANDYGVWVWPHAGGNNIVWNNITSNNRGIYIEMSGINIIHHNNFVDNTNDWWDYGLTPWPFQLPFSVNIWDDGIEGNYWNNYDGTDSNGDGIGDTPHNLYENNTDNHPLIEQTIIPEFPSWAILPLFIIASVIGILIRKRLTRTRTSAS